MDKKKKRILWIIVIILFILSALGGIKKSEDCDLTTFIAYTYDVGCFSACSVKCYDNGFEYTSSAYFEPPLSYDEMMNLSLYKQCECNCEGCQE